MQIYTISHEMMTATLIVGAAAPGLRERKLKAVKGRIVDAAIRLCTERGFDQTTIDDIARAAEVSARTFFRYFDSKEAAVLDRARTLKDRLFELVVCRPVYEPPVAAARNAIREVYNDAYGSNFRERRALGNLLATTPKLQAKVASIRAFGSEQIARGLATRLADDPQNLRLMVVAAQQVWAAVTAVECWLATADDRSLDCFLDHAFLIIDDVYLS